MAMLLAGGALLGNAATMGYDGADKASRALREAVLETSGSGCRTADLGGHASTTEFTDSVIERVRVKLDVQSSP
jgi:isocitrate/isopropylmalate dehydrogenase